MRNLAVMLAFGALLIVAPARAELLLNISKSQQRISVSVDGEEAYRWPVSTGRKGYSTPTGTYRPERLERHWYSRKYDWAPMPWSVFFHRGYAMHGTTETQNLGRPASHGCVRLRPDNASVLFSMVRRYGAKKTKVVVTDGPLPRLPGAQPMAETPRAPTLAMAAEKEASNGGGEAKRDIASRKDKDKGEAGSEHLSAKASQQPAGQKTTEKSSLRAYGAQARAADSDDEPVARRPQRTQVAVLERVSVSVGNEAQVMRERDAWLRAIDRKYGISR